MQAKMFSEERSSNETEDIIETFQVYNANNSEIPTYDFGPEYHRTVRVYTLGVMFVISLVGNLMVLHQLAPFRRGHFPKSKVLFLNLATSDLFVTFATMLSQLIWDLMDNVWIAGDPGCRIFKFLQTYSMSSSTYILVAIALERYNAIVRPFAQSHDPKVYAMGAWLIALLPALPCFIVFHQVKVSETTNMCVSIFYTSPKANFWRRIYVFCVFLVAFIAPFVLLFVFYCRLMAEIRARSSVFTPNQQTVSSLPRARIKTLKMTSTILLTFLILSSPYIVYELFITFGYGDLINKNIGAFAGVLSASNSAVNPYIYLIFQSKKTRIGTFIRNIATVIRSKQWSTSSHRQDTSFVSANSRSSSRVEMNLTNSIPPSRASRGLSITNGTKKTDVTFV